MESYIEGVSLEQVLLEDLLQWRLCEDNGGVELLELQEIGWIGEKMPRLVAVQADGCAPIVKAWKEKKAESEFWKNSSTVAFGINVPKALGDFLVLINEE